MSGIRFERPLYTFKLRDEILRLSTRLKKKKRVLFIIIKRLFILHIVSYRNHEIVFTFMYIHTHINYRL